MVAAVCFAKAPPLLGQVFFLIYEGVSRRPEARRCPRPIWGGGACGHCTRPRGATPFGPPAPPRGHLLCNDLLSINIDVVFFPEFISCKNSQGRDFAKNSVKINSFIQIWKDLGANYEAKFLEKWMHFGCIITLQMIDTFRLSIFLKMQSLPFNKYTSTSIH